MIIRQQINSNSYKLIKNEANINSGIANYDN